MKCILLFAIFSCLSLTSCILSTWDTRLKLVNNTNKNLKYIDELMNKDSYVPDLTYCQTTELYNLPAKSEKTVRSQTKWEFLFKNHPEDFLRLYIVDEDSLKKYGTCKILGKQIILKRFDLKYEDMKKLDWKIVYTEK